MLSESLFVKVKGPAMFFGVSLITSGTLTAGFGDILVVAAVVEDVQARQDSTPAINGSSRLSLQMTRPQKGGTRAGQSHLKLDSFMATFHEHVHAAWKHATSLRVMQR